jgi:PASTA domain/Divergent InlB B-repeat domain
MGPLRAALAGALVLGGLVLAPAAGADITASQITTPSNPSFFVADEDASTQTFAIAGTTTGAGANDRVDLNCYFGATHVTVAKSVPVGSDGSFSLPTANLNKPLALTCRLRAVPAGTNPSNLTPFSGPVIGVGERESSKLSGGPNDGKTYDYYADAQQLTAAFDYASLGNCGLQGGYLYDSAYANTTITFACAAGLGSADSPATPTRSELQIDGANAYAPSSAAAINPNGTDFPALTDTYTVDKATGNVVLNETDPIVKCSKAAYPPTTSSCATFLSTGVTDHRTITQDHDGHIGWVTDVFASTDGKAHSLDLLWDSGQRFWGPSGNSTQLEYEFPGQSSYSTHATGDTVSLPSTAAGIFVRMHGAADGDTSTGQGAIVYDRPVTAAKFTAVLNFASEMTLHQTGSIPAGGSARFRFAYVQGYASSDVASDAQIAANAFLNTITVSKSGKGKVTSSPGGISCGKACSHGYAYGTQLTLKAKPAAGSRFSGWSGACKGTSGCKLTVDAAVTAKAKFVLRQCVVPNVVGKSLRAAKRAIRKALCSVGKVRKAASSRRKGLVVSQSPKRDRRLKQHAKVSLVVSKG